MNSGSNPENTQSEINELDDVKFKIKQVDSCLTTELSNILTLIENKKSDKIDNNNNSPNETDDLNFKIKQLDSRLTTELGKIINNKKEPLNEQETETIVQNTISRLKLTNFDIKQMIVDKLTGLSIEENTISNLQFKVLRLEKKNKIENNLKKICQSTNVEFSLICCYINFLCIQYRDHLLKCDSCKKFHIKNNNNNNDLASGTEDRQRIPYGIPRGDPGSGIGHTYRPAGVGAKIHLR